jgi:hypothetical protein
MTATFAPAPDGHRLIVMCPSCQWWTHAPMPLPECLRCGTPPRRIWAWISCPDGCFAGQFDEWVECDRHGASTVLLLDRGVGWL